MPKLLPLEWEHFRLALIGGGLTPAEFFHQHLSQDGLMVQSPPPRGEKVAASIGQIGQWDMIDYMHGRGCRRACDCSSSSAACPWNSS